MERLWRLLEDLRTVAAVDSEWRQWLGIDPCSVAPWRRRAASLARSLPFEGGPRRRVVALDDDTIVAVDDESGDELAITETDCIVHELNLERLTADMQAEFLLEGQAERLERGLHRLGVHLGVGGTATPIFFAFAESAEALLALVSRCVAREPGRVAIVTPTSRHWSEPIRALLRTNSSVLLRAGQLLEIHDGALRVVAPLESLIATAAAAPKSRIATSPRFPTPPRSTWRDVRIRFVDGETVIVSVSSVTQRYLFGEMRMGHSRSKKPTVLWTLLRNLASANGTLTWSDHGSSRKVPKNIERLSRLLRAFFSISGDPIPYDASVKGYRTAFSIEPD